ncbi:cytochrome P450 2D17-like [Marmota flaviventris]|uniref:cytochrome P450 2D17-like n=1 Tax=Marmota flaviventris TaxID=93162 RepID=UPI003A8644AE
MGLLTGPLCVAVAVFLLLVDLMHRRQLWAARYPPGPLPQPGLGNLLQIDFQNMPYPRYKWDASGPHGQSLATSDKDIVRWLDPTDLSLMGTLTFCLELWHQFGDVFSLQLAWKPGVLVNGLVVLATYGPAWRKQQHFSMSTMHNFGLGKKSLEQWVIEEPRTLLNRAVCNVISSLIYAHHFENHDQRLAKILGLLEDTLKQESGFMPEVLNVVPVLLRIPGLSGWVFPAQKAFMAMVDELLEEHRMTWDPAQPPRDLTDAFLAEVGKVSDYESQRPLGGSGVNEGQKHLRPVSRRRFSHPRVACSLPAAPVAASPGRPSPAGVILASYGPAWREQRRFSVSTMRNLGLGKKSLERWVTEEASCLCTAFANKAGCPFNPMSLLKRAVCNVISSLIYARRFKYDDQRLAKMLDFLEDMLKEDSGFVPMVLNVVPVLLRIPGLPGWVFPAQKAFMDMVDELLEEHRMTWDPAQPPRDLTDAFLAEVEKAKGNPESSFNDENLRIVVLDLFTAGMVTTSTTLAWALLLMILHPDVQRRVQQEIDEVIGQVRQPEMGDQARMPFTMAVIHEVQRFGDLVPLSVPHLTTRDIELQGFFIPKVGLGPSSQAPSDQ